MVFSSLQSFCAKFCVSCVLILTCSSQLTIFDRKAWIEGQLREQIESYGQSLAYNLLADGRRPPPWLWDTGSDALRPKELSREQLVQGIIFPLPWATTPSTNHNTLHTLPALKSTNMCQYSSFASEMCISNECIYPEHNDGDTRDGIYKDHEKECDIACSEDVKDSPVFDQIGSAQCYRSMQRKPESHLNKKLNAANSGDECIIKQYARKATRTMAASLMPEHVEETSDMKNSMVPNGIATQTLDCPPSLDNISKPLRPSGFIISKASANQASFMQTPSREAPDLIANSDDASAREQCTRAVAKEFVLNGSNSVVPGLEAVPSENFHHSHNQLLAVVKKLSFDGIKACHQNQKFYGSFSQKKNLCCTSGALRKFQSVPSLKEDPLCKDSVPDFGAFQLGEDASNAKVVQSARVAVRDSTARETESHCCPPSTTYDMNHQKHSSPSEETKNLNLTNAPTSSTSMLRSCLNFSDHQSFQYNFCQGSPSRSLTEQSAMQRSGEPITSGQASIVATRQPQIISDVKQIQYLSDNIKPYDINKDRTTTFAGETKGSCFEFSFSESLQCIKDEELHRNSKTVLILSGKKQLQHENVLPATEVIRKEAERISGKDHVERDELLNTVDTVGSRLCAKISPHVPAVRSLEMVSATDSSKKQSDGSLVDHRTKGSCKGKLVKRSVCSQDELTDDVQSAHSVPLIDEVILETEVVEVITVENRIAEVSQSNLIVDTAENYSAGLGCQPLRSSSANFDVSISDGSDLPCPDDYMSLSASENLIDTTTGDVHETILTKKSPNAAKMESKLTRASYSLRSFTSAPKDVGLSKGNAYISPSLEKFFSVTKKDKNSKNIMDAMEKSITRLSYNVRTQNRSSESRYFLRSLNRHGKTYSYSELNLTGNTTSSKRSSELMTDAREISWPKRRKLICYSDGVLATSRITLHQLPHTQEDTCCSSKVSSEIVPLEEMQITPSPSENVLNMDTENAEFRINSEFHQQSKRQCLKEDESCLKSKDQIMDIPLPTQCTKGVTSPSLAHGNSRTCLMIEIGGTEFTLSEPKEPGSSGNDVDGKSSHVVSEVYCHNLQSTEEGTVSDVGKSLSKYGAFVLSNFQNDLAVNCDDSMPEFEGFNIGVSPVKKNDICYDVDYPCFKEENISLDVQQDNSTHLVTPRARPSGNYKINNIPDLLQSLPNGLLEHLHNDSLCFYGDYTRQFRSEHDKISDLYNSLGSSFDCSFVERSSSNSTPFSARFAWASSKAPLTPPIENSVLRKASRKSGASSQTVGTNPELVCFRIDENSSTTEDIEHHDKLSTSKEGICSRGIQVLNNRESLKDVTSVYENASTLVPFTKMLLESGSLEFSNPKSHSGTQTSFDSLLTTTYTGNKDRTADKENQCLSINGKKEGKVVKSLCNKPEINVKAVERNRSQASIQKGCKPNNIISNISSFIPMLQKKQQATTTKGKKDIKVKALEAAEAAKHLEEKKQNEREMRKAAAKLERERLEQEKQLKQKQLEEQKRRKEVDIAARKRQREEERKEKERKRRCTEETRKLQREQDERLHTKKEEKELRCKAADDDGRKKGLVLEAKQQLKSEKGGEVAGSRNTVEVEPVATKVVIRSDCMKGIIQGRMSTTKGNLNSQSYEISPYKDSDDEDGEEENMHRRKHSPSWADSILLCCSAVAIVSVVSFGLSAANNKPETVP
ncbi:Inner centromere protein, ARK binding region [Musa troglodytarum]|uniref:Inner centromere protein, ARK binding region n=1 Tax=Musa troglodytarum TaxID=320322 RepID=A0A9E7HUP7_9LILI|nr:Inner centromere protein, ARK binding region [Musa troglodytarum]